MKRELRLETVEGPMCSRVCAVQQVLSAPLGSFSGSSEFMGQDLFVSTSMLACERKGNRAFCY